MSMRALEQNLLNVSDLGSAMPDWLLPHREARRAEFLRHGIPDRHHERFKYTNFDVLMQDFFVLNRGNVQVDKHQIDSYRMPDAILIVLIDGFLSREHSDLKQLPQTVQVMSLNEALMLQEEAIKPHLADTLAAWDYPFAALNDSLFTDGLFISIADDSELPQPLHILSLSTGQAATVAHIRHVITAGKNSQATLLQEYRSCHDANYFTNVVTTLALDAGAKLQFNKLQQESRQALHMENLIVKQGRDSEAVINQLSLGAHFSRDDAVISLREPGAICRTSGIYCTRADGQYTDHHINVYHQAPRTASEMVYKGILDGKSRAVFNGGVLIAKDAQKINAHQENHNLLLSAHAEINSKPELEIYADDVKCRHGATTGQMDEEALFYLRARGIDEATATRILLQGFVEDVLQKITHPVIRQHAMKQVTFL